MEVDRRLPIYEGYATDTPHLDPHLQHLREIIFTKEVPTTREGLRTALAHMRPSLVQWFLKPHPKNADQYTAFLVGEASRTYQTYSWALDQLSGLNPLSQLYDRIHQEVPSVSHHQTIEELDRLTNSAITYAYTENFSSDQLAYLNVSLSEQGSTVRQSIIDAAIERAETLGLSNVRKTFDLLETSQSRAYAETWLWKKTQEKEQERLDRLQETYGQIQQTFKSLEAVPPSLDDLNSLTSLHQHMLDGIQVGFAPAIDRALASIMQKTEARIGQLALKLFSSDHDPRPHAHRVVSRMNTIHHSMEAQHILDSVAQVDATLRKLEDPHSFSAIQHLLDTTHSLTGKLSTYREWLDEYEPLLLNFYTPANLSVFLHSLEKLDKSGYIFPQQETGRHPLKKALDDLKSLVHHIHVNADYIHNDLSYTKPFRQSLSYLKDHGHHIILRFNLPHELHQPISEVVCNNLGDFALGLKAIRTLNDHPDADLIAPLERGLERLSFTGWVYPLPAGNSVSAANIAERIQTVIKAAKSYRYSQRELRQHPQDGNLKQQSRTTMKSLNRLLQALPDIPNAQIKEKVLLQLLRADPDLTLKDFPKELGKPTRHLEGTIRRKQRKSRYIQIPLKKLYRWLFR